MSVIRVLEDALVDQIAAGEVVERPASVVKELVENALDAGATRVRIEVRDGGIGWIAVEDDGAGMTADDARLALCRHATSKIRALADLDRIGSYGFRGEALPAIASVSTLRLRTRPRDAEHAFELRIEGGREVSAREVGGPPGTRVEVADLFANVPARRKFLKRPTTEWSHVSDWIARSALALPGVHFEVARDDRAPWVWPATGDRLERIAAVLSERDASAFVAVDREEQGARLHGFASAPEHTRANSLGLYLFVNERPVRDPLLRGAVLQVYRDWLPRGRFPSAVLFLDVPPGEVDVNVHPAKWEVRFRDAAAIRSLVRHALRDAIGERRWLGGAPHVPLGEATPPGAVLRAPATDHVAEPSDWILTRRDTPASARTPGAAPEHAPGAPPGAVDTPLRFGDMRPVGQLLASYLLVEGKGGLILVDQHAAHERVLYERLRGEWLARGVERQALLAPEIVELDPAAAARLAEHGEAIERLGFEVAAFGESAVAVRATPALLGGRDPAALVRELADAWGDEEAGEGGAADDVRRLRAVDRLFATLACHSARRFGDQLGAEEARAILEGLDAIPWAPTCPHGRPVAIVLDRADIERRFGRR